jgi:hypothetical protein
MIIGRIRFRNKFSRPKKSVLIRFLLALRRSIFKPCSVLKFLMPNGSGLIVIDSMKDCLITTLGKSEQFPEALRNLESALRNSMTESVQFKIESMPSLNSTIEHFANAVVPHFLIVDPKTFERADPENSLERFFRGLRELDPAVCIIVLWTTQPSAQEIMTWLDRGATGLYNPKISHPAGDSALLEALALRVSAHLAREPRAHSRHIVKIQIASLEQAMAAETLNLGFGGMFLRISPRDMKVGDEVEFQLEFGGSLGVQGESDTDHNPLVKKMDDPGLAAHKGILTSLEGTGRVVWVRSTQKDGLPEGIGLQFSKLSPEVQKQIRNFVVNHRLHAFIPKA